MVFAMGMHTLSNSATTTSRNSKRNNTNRPNTDVNNNNIVKSALTVDSLVTRQRLQVTNTIAFLHKRTAQLTRLLQQILHYY